MRLSQELMADPAIQYKKIGDFAKRTNRSEWAEKNESIFRNLCPYPITYDVNQGQSTYFSEFTYTELLKGIWVATQSAEVNCRIFEDASKYDGPRVITNLTSLVEDKYKLQSDVPQFDRVAFLPGHNMLDVASIEIIGRLAYEEEDIVFKPHPITHDDALRMIAGRVGWQKVLPKDYSGNTLLNNCTDVYTTSASEMAISGTILGKNVHNISNFFNEGSGAYHCISRILFLAHRRHGMQAANEALLNIVNCPWSGVVVPLHTDVEERLKTYYRTALEYRARYRTLSSPHGNPPKKVVKP